MKVAIRKHFRDFLAVLGLVIVALGVSGYILSQQRLRFPFIEKKPKEIQAEFQSSQAVLPGQGQTVRVAGVEIGEIGGVQLKNGVAVVKLEIKPKYKNVIRRDATVLLRPKTPLKDMFMEVSPGSGKVLPEGGTLPVANSLPDVNPDEVYEALDSDARDYLKLLVVGGGKGLQNRGGDLREVFRRLGPLHRDLARVTQASARRRHALKRLVHNYSELVTELGRHRDDLSRVVTASRDVFSATASQDTNISSAVAQLPGTLRRTEATLNQVDRFAPLLRSSLQSLRPAIRRLAPTNAAVRPLLEDTEPALRKQIRPFVRRATPYAKNLSAAAKDTVRGLPDLTTSVSELNRFFNMGAYNPGGAEGLSGKSVAQQRNRQEGFLYWLAWTAQNGVSLFNTADAQGPWRRLTICGLPDSVVTGLLGQLIANVQANAPAQFQQLLNQLGATEANLAQKLVQASGGFGACSF
ncbi:MAG TPA: MlaD family protein [Thermoleophilaceae bacterium]|jgi:phospholipid/cholesterol/gamma-HCH transport system substrate-binding protein